MVMNNKATKTRTDAADRLNLNQDATAGSQSAPSFPTARPSSPRRGKNKQRPKRALRDRERHLEAILNALPDLMFRVDRDSRIFEFHPQEATAFYVPPPQFLGQKMTEILPAPAAEVIGVALAEAAVQGHHRGAIYSLPFPPGSVSWYELSITAMGPKGAPDRDFIMLARDITARKTAEAQIQHLNATLEQRVAERTAQLRASEQRYRDLNEHLESEVAARTAELQAANALLREREERLQFVLEGSRLGTWDWNLATGEVRRNDYWAEMLGFNPQELNDATTNLWLELVHPEDRERASRAIEAHLAGKTPLFEQEYRMRTRAGGYRWILDRGRIVSRDEAGRPLRIAGTFKDITLRKEMEFRLRQSEERFRLVVDHALDNIWTMGPDYRLSFLSPSVQSLVGYSVEEYLGLTLDQMLMPDSLAVALAYFARLDECRAAGLDVVDCTFRGEIEVRAKDGSGLWTEIIVTPLVDEAGRLLELAGVTRDIRERKRYELELQQARAAAEGANQAKSDYLAHMSHEIRNPLNAILGLVQLLEREPLGEVQRTLVSSIQSAGESLLFIVNDVLDLSKIEAGQFTIEPQPCNLEPRLIKVRDFFAPRATLKGVALELDSQADLLGPVEVDGQRLEQVLVNLLGNALKFTTQGRVELRVLIQASSQEEVRLRFEVRDTGIGIAPAKQVRLFEPYYQGEANTHGHYRGTGLGLAICKRLVELMGGRIGVESQPGQGSTFWFELALKRSTHLPPSSADATSEPAPVASNLAGLKVLVVDDSEINRVIVEQALSLDGVAVTLAEDGRQAVRLLRQAPGVYDAVLMDVQMPDLDGLVATRLIRSELGLTELPIIALTAGILPKQRQQALDAGMNDVLSKPIQFPEMTAVLRKWT